MAILISLIILGVVLIKFFPGSKIVPPVTVNLPPMNVTEVNWKIRTAGKKRKAYEKAVLEQWIPEIMRHMKHLQKHPQDVGSINKLKKLVERIEKSTSSDTGKKVYELIKKYAPHIYNN